MFLPPKKIGIIDSMRMKDTRASDNFINRTIKAGLKISKYGNLAREHLEFDHTHPLYTMKIHNVQEKKDDGKWEEKHREVHLYPAKRR